MYFSKLCLFAALAIVFATTYWDDSFGASSSGILIPLYVFPFNDTSWQPLIDVKTNHPNVPIIAVINPFNGPGTVLEEHHNEQIPRLQAVGIKTIGYVTTHVANKPIDDVKLEIDSWKQLYPNIEGIFFDEMSNLPGNEPYYSELDAYAKSKDGFDFTVGNAGVDTIPSYVGTVDNIVIHENNSLPSLEELDGWHASYDKSNFSYLVHSQPLLDASFLTSSSNHVRFMYITDDHLDSSAGINNPWDAISSYIETLAQVLDEPSVEIAVESRDFFGNQITGANNIEISANNVKVRNGSSILFYNATKNIHYSISAVDFGNFTFAHWENFDENNTRTITPLQDTALVAFYDNANNMVDIPLQTNTTHAIVGKAVEECFLINGNVIIESGSCTVKSITTPNDAGVFIVQFRLDVTPNHNGAAKNFAPENMPSFESFFSTCKWRDANGNLRSTEDWRETVSASGKAVLTCKFSKP